MPSTATPFSLRLRLHYKAARVGGVSSFGKGMRVEISKTERDTVLALDEDHFYDLKAKEISPSKLSESVSAFANAAGGEIFVGVKETRKGAHKVRSWDGFGTCQPVLNTSRGG